MCMGEGDQGINRCVQYGGRVTANYGNQINSGPFVSGLNFASKNSLARGCRGGKV